MARRKGDSSDRMFLVVVMEFCEEGAGRVMEALQAEKLTAMRLPHPAHLKLATDKMKPRVFVVDCDDPGEKELTAVRAMRAKNRSGSLIVVVCGTVPEQKLSPELCELADAYLRKPLAWELVARTVIQLANDRKPPTGVVTLR